MIRGWGGWALGSKIPKWASRARQKTPHITKKNFFNYFLIVLLFFRSAESAIPEYDIKTLRARLSIDGGRCVGLWVRVYINIPSTLV